MNFLRGLLFYSVAVTIRKIQNIDKKRYIFSQSEKKLFICKHKRAR